MNIVPSKARSDIVASKREDNASPEWADEMGKLPKAWEWSPLGKLATVVRGGSPRPAGDPRYFGGDIPWITVGPITSDKTPYLRSVSQTVTEAGKERSRFVEPGTLLLTNSGATLGVPKITLIGGCINDGVAALLNVPEPLKLYLLYFLQTQTERLRGVNQGAAQPNLNTSIIKDISIPLAPPDEQRRIVAEIEKQFTRLEAGVAALRRVQANLKRYRAAVLKAACEGRLVPTEAELQKSEGRSQKSKARYESGEALLARILTERRQNWQGRGQYKEPAALDTAKLFPLPAGWKWTTLDALAEIKGGITKDQNRKHTAPARSVPYLRVANVQRGYIDLAEVKEIVTTEDEIRELALKPGDILFNEGGDRDKLGRGWVWNGELAECIHQNHVFRARLHVTELNPKLVSWYANTFGQKFFFDEGKHTTNLASISMSKLKGLPVPIPPPAEQTRIVAEVERLLSVVEELEAVVSANLQRATRLRRSILDRAFTGNL